MIIFLASSSVVFADEPDLRVYSSDITLSDDSVHYSTNITVWATVHNDGECYIVLGDDGDEVDYSESFSAGQILKVKASVRSTDGGLITARAYTDEVTDFGVFTTSSLGWEVVETASFNATSSSSIYLKLYAGGDADTDLEVDWIEVYKETTPPPPDPPYWTLLYTREAETYDSGGLSVNHIYPQDVIVKFYDGDPDAGGTQFGITHNTGNVQKRIGIRPDVWILTEGGSSQVWNDNTWDSAGVYNVYVTIDNDPRETNTGNNEASKQLALYSNLTISRAHGSGITDPAIGVHQFYGTDEDVVAYPGTNCAFDYWELDGAPTPDDSTITVSTYLDHSLDAYFFCWGIPTLSQWGLIMLMTAVIGFGVMILLRRKKHGMA